MPLALPEALPEGLVWDATGRRHATLSGEFDCSARVAAAVGAMMCVPMRVRHADALARAEVAFLVDATANPRQAVGRSEAVLAVLAQPGAQDRARRDRRGSGTAPA